MKRLVFIFAFLLCCFAIQANARGIMTMCGAGVPVAGCVQEKLHSQETATAVLGIGYDTSTAYRATTYTAVTNDPIKTLYLPLDKDGDDNAGVVTAYLCPDNSGAPPNISTCTAADATVAHSALPADPGYVKFVFSAGYAQVADTAYIIAAHFAYIDGTVVANWSYNSSVVGESMYRDGNGIPNWQIIDSTGQHNYKAYKCEE